MYLVLKVHCDQEFLSGPEVPQVAVMDLDSQRGHLESCSRVMSESTMVPRPVSSMFAMPDVHWLASNDGIEEHDFYQEVMANGMTLVKSLPESMLSEDPVARAEGRQLWFEPSCITIHTSNPTAFILETEIGGTSTTLYTDQFDLEDLNRLEPYEGVLIQEECGPGR